MDSKESDGRDENPNRSGIQSPKGADKPRKHIKKHGARGKCDEKTERKTKRKGVETRCQSHPSPPHYLSGSIHPLFSTSLNKILL